MVPQLPTTALALGDVIGTDDGADRISQTMQSDGSCLELRTRRAVVLSRVVTGYDLLYVALIVASCDSMDGVVNGAALQTPEERLRMHKCCQCNRCGRVMGTGARKRDRGIM